MIDGLIIYYFTGTGNALAASKWIAEVSELKNIPVEILQITPSLKVDSETLTGNKLVGFCYPTHGFNAPPVVIDFILRFPKSQNRVFLLNTRAGMKLSKVFTPGLSGLAQLFPALVLLLKGYQIVGLQPMDLPSNWISIHPGLRKKVVDSIFKRCESITKTFAEKILSEKNVYQGLISLPIDILISPISAAYFFLGRFALAKTFVADNSCNSCSLCEMECPVNAIIMRNNRPFWTSKCESCMHCMNRCPQRSIQTPHLFVAVVWWLVFFVIPLFILKELLQLNPEEARFYNLIFDVVTIVTGFPIIFFSYRILHFLMKYRFFNILIEYTSLTRFKFWRRYFAPKQYITRSHKI
jgi:Pyruvate/2-oxoacid:ferredoxin oxidoreductase delta subunit